MDSGQQRNFQLVIREINLIIRQNRRQVYGRTRDLDSKVLSVSFSNIIQGVDGDISLDTENRTLRLIRVNIQICEEALYTRLFISGPINFPLQDNEYLIYS